MANENNKIKNINSSFGQFGNFGCKIGGGKVRFNDEKQTIKAAKVTAQNFNFPTIKKTGINISIPEKNKPALSQDDKEKKKKEFVERMKAGREKKRLEKMALKEKENQVLTENTENKNESIPE